MKSTLNHNAMKDTNRLRIFSIVRDRGPVTRSNIRRESNLSWGSITALSRELLENNMIAEVGPVITGVGRRAVYLDINCKTNFVVGVSFGATNLRVVLVDLKGNVLKRMEEPTDAKHGKDNILKQLFGLINAILYDNGIEEKYITGIGIGVPGVVDVKSGICRYFPHLPGWENVPLRSLVKEKIGVPVLIDHNTNCAALAEKWFGTAQEVRNVLCVTLGSGIGLGIIINGEVYRGLDGTAGEFGHTTVDVDGPVCSCGSKGCLESYASGNGIAILAADALKNKRESQIYSLANGNIENITAEIVCQAAETGDQLALQIFEDMGRYLGLGIANLIKIFNPEFVVLAGKLCYANKFFMPALKNIVHEKTWKALEKEVRISQLGDDHTAVGASGIVLQEIFAGRLKSAGWASRSLKRNYSFQKVSNNRDRVLVK